MANYVYDAPQPEIGQGETMTEETNEKGKVERAIEILETALTGQAPVSKNTLIKDAIKALRS